MTTPESSRAGTARSVRQTIEAYFAALRAGAGWEDRFADDVVFTSHGTPAKRVSGRAAFLESTRGFYGMIEDVEVVALLVDRDAACARARYRLRPPGHEAFTSDVAEFFSVRGGRIVSLAIYFDSAPYPAGPGPAPGRPLTA